MAVSTLAKALNYANDSFLSTVSPGSTKVVVHVLDGLISSPDTGATISNDQGNFSSTYSYSVPADTRFRPNVTLLQNPPVLTATREVSSGSAVDGGLVSVTLLLRNTGQGTAITNIKANDTWWTGYSSVLSLSAGNSSVDVGSLAAGQNASDVYVLKVSSSTSEDIVVPALTISYSYSIGNTTVNASTQTNQVEIRTNYDGPALSITAATSIPSGSPWGPQGSSS